MQIENQKIQDAIDKDQAKKRKSLILLAVLSISIVFVYFICISLGSVRLPLSDVINSLMGNSDNWGNDIIVNDIRAPRVLTAGVVGAALSVGGMAMQALFKNPMASPSVLGISSGASFGAAFYIAYGSAIVMSSFGTVLCAFSMALMTMMLVYGLAYKKIGGVQTTMLLLAGMAISALFSGLTSMIQFFSDEETVTSIVFWMLGSFDGATWSDLQIMIIPTLIGIIMILANLRELNLLTAGESKARALGVNVKRTRLLLLVGSSLLVAGTVAFCGVIGFVGLIIPHMFRALIGPDHKRLAPICILGGAIFLMIVDTFARSAFPPYEIPVGTITSIIGAPFFLWILRSRKNEIWRN